MVQNQVRWRCRTRSCTGAVYLSVENVIQSLKEHSCNETIEKRNSIIARFQIKESLKTTNEPILRTITKINSKLTSKVT